MRETGDHLLWMYRTFLDAEGLRYWRHASLWTLACELSKLTQPWLLGYGIIALHSKDALAAHIAFVFIVLFQFVSMLMQWKASCQRELFIGQCSRVIERVINTSFFSKDLGLHIEESSVLGQSSMEKGRERADKIAHAVIFNGVEIVISLVVTFAILCIIEPLAGVITLLTLVASLGTSLFMNSEVAKAADPIDEELKALVRHRNERMRAVERVMTNGKATHEVAAIDARFDRLLNRPGGDRAVWIGYLNRVPLRETINIIGFALVTYLLGWKVFYDFSTPSELVSAVTWIWSVLTQVRLFARLERDIAFCLPSLKRVRIALDLPNRVVDRPNAIDLPDAPVEITFENVSHRYKNGQNVLEQLNFTVGQGQSAALIGPSGAGKSTIVRLVQRFMDPTCGRILVNGIDMRDIRKESWERLVAYIPQKPQIMDGTLRENLLYGLSADEEAAWDDDRLWSFVRRFRVDFGERLTDGLNTKVGEQGIELSGGEAQRVMIAAAAIRKARLYIVDEATASLDAESQAAVQNALYELIDSGATAIFIAHRLSTTRRCNDFIVLQSAADARIRKLPQVEATANSFTELTLCSPTFRRLAALEGISTAA